MCHQSRARNREPQPIARMYTFFERLFDPLAPSQISRPPTTTAAFFWHFLGPIRGLLIVTLLISGIAASAELALYAFPGVLVDWMTVSRTEGRPVGTECVSTCRSRWSPFP